MCSPLHSEGGFEARFEKCAPACILKGFSGGDCGLAWRAFRPHTLLSNGSAEAEEPTLQLALASANVADQEERLSVSTLDPCAFPPRKVWLVGLRLRGRRPWAQSNRILRPHRGLPGAIDGARDPHFGSPGALDGASDPYWGSTGAIDGARDPHWGGTGAIDGAWDPHLGLAGAIDGAWARPQRQ